ncbi:cobalamin biosynthesis protein CobG [Kitasatospora sp. NPDC058965]|uniref:cobalamin biosynthesis protein CobG n=1 Tax=Kitasatospora sp. NPDC058965 TaxID=3346682 RepID=UPI0036CD1B8A
MSPSPASFEPAPNRAVRGRDDACPGALRLHRADDGALARVRVPGGLLAADQAHALADAATELGDGQLETTSRGNVQLRGLAQGCGAELAERLSAAGLLPSLSHDRVRNIVASPLAGLDGGPGLQGWLDELDTLLQRSERARALSGRFLFALDDGRGDTAGLDADLTLIARPDGGALLRPGRAAVAARVEDGPRAALRAAEAFLAVADGAWRVREADPDGSRLFAALGLTPGPLPELPGTRPAVGRHPGALVVGLRFGRAGAEQWHRLADAAHDGLRVTPWRSVVLPGVAAVAIPGLRTDPASPWEGATACTGAPGCAKSLADVRADAAAGLDATTGSGGLPVHWSGCERRCGHPSGQWVDVLATGPDTYRISQQSGSTTEVTNHQMAAAVADARRTT